MDAENREILSAITWPIPPGETRAPVWSGHGFRIDDRILPVLRADVGDSGWNAALAELLFLESAPDRPIGMASRRGVLDALRKYRAAGPGKVVLEIGSATGFLLKDISSNFPGTQLIGSDYEIAPLETLASKHPDIPLVQLDLPRSNLPDRFCDAIIALNVLEHIEDDAAALQQIFRMLKPGGLLVVEVPAGPRLYDSFDRLVGHFRRYTMKELTAKIEGEGFQIRDRRHLGFVVYPLFWAYKKWRHRAPRDGDGNGDLQSLTAALRAGRGGLVQRIAFAMENLIGRIATPPFGIRCVVAAVRKPATG